MTTPVSSPITGCARTLVTFSTKSRASQKGSVVGVRLLSDDCDTAVGPCSAKPKFATGLAVSLTIALTSVGVLASNPFGTVTTTVYSPSAFNFVDTQIEDIIKEVENQFGVSIAYDKSVAKERITLKTNAESADKLLSIISETMGSTFSIKK